MAKLKRRSHRDAPMHRNSKGSSSKVTKRSRHPSSSRHRPPSHPSPARPASRAPEPRPLARTPTSRLPRTSPDHGHTGGKASAFCAHSAILAAFPSHEPVLLVGEGDFSFARCLHDVHGCRALTATTLLSADALAQTHAPAGPANAAALLEAGQKVLYDVDATTLGRPGIPGGKTLRRARFATVAFNFPHVGGQSTDVARQARANQELLRSFLVGARRVLWDRGGRVVVTLWEGPAYEAWDLRGLAREAGLRVERSGKLDWGLWKGYRHVRNAGKEIMDEGRSWSGERSARMWILRAREDLDAEREDRRRRSLISDDDDDDDLDEVIADGEARSYHVDEASDDIMQRQSDTSESWNGIEGDA